MRNRNMRGGAIDNNLYTKFENILGESFRALLVDMKTAKQTGDVSKFTYANYPGGKKPSGAKDEDISHLFTQRLMATANILSELEGGITKYDTASDKEVSAQDIKKIFGDITKNKPVIKQFPYHKSLTYRPSFYQLIGSDDKLYKSIYPDSDISVDERVIRYLYGFVALLENPAADKVVNVALHDPVFSEWIALIRDKIEKKPDITPALKSLVSSIIALQNKISPTGDDPKIPIPPKIIISALAKDSNTAQDISKLDGGDEKNISALGSIKQLVDIAKTAITGGIPNEYGQYIQNFLRNSQIIGGLPNDIEDDKTVAMYQSGGGGESIGSDLDDADESIPDTTLEKQKLPWLYGVVDDEGKRHRLDKAQPESENGEADKWLGSDEDNTGKYIEHIENATNSAIADIKDVKYMSAGIITMHILDKVINKIGEAFKNENADLLGDDVEIDLNVDGWKNTHTILSTDMDSEKLKNDFVNALVKLVSVKKPVDKGEKKNLSDDTVYKFYKEHILKHPDTYMQVLNIVDVDSNNIYTSFPPVISEEDRKKYRLNVKKAEGAYVKGTELTGGAIMTAFASLIPPFTGKTVWVSPTVHFDTGATSLETIIDEFIVSYTNPVVSGVPVPITDDIINDVVYTHYVPSNTLKNILDSIDGDMEISGWRGTEASITRAALELARKKADKDKVNKDDNAICEFVTDPTFDCLSSVINCAQGKMDDDARCTQLLNLDYSKIASMTPDQKKDTIVKVDARWAYVILRALCFSWYNHKADHGYLRGLTYRKVQSVGDWLNELQNDNNLTQCLGDVGEGTCRIISCIGKDNAKKILGMIKNTNDSNKGFFQFLDLLVQWLNIHPDVLNQELDLNAQKGTADKDKYSKADPLYNIYSHINPYENSISNVNRIICKTMRVRDELTNGLSGIDLLQGFLDTKDVLSMPLNRYVVGSPYPNYHSQFGGDAIYDSIEALQGTFTSNTIRQLYSELKAVMQRYGKAKPSANTEKRITEALETVQAKENELKAEIRKLAQEIELYKRSGGRINVLESGLSEEQLRRIKEKHGYLNDKTKSYSRKAINIVDALQTMANALMGKVESQQTQGSLSRNRPLNRGYYLKKH